MIINANYADSFEEYKEPLQKLEEAFGAAGRHFVFEPFIDRIGQKVIKVHGGCASQKLISIEADSPAMAVKDVAEGVRLW
jgi:hypothetical protein